MKWFVEFYSAKNGNSPVKDFILGLRKKEQAKIIRQIELLEEYGINLSYPYAEKIKGEQYKGLWELRIKFSTNSFRIFYFLYIENKFVLLHAFKKKSENTPDSELQISLKRMKEYFDREG
jgi:phage-related protein